MRKAEGLVLSEMGGTLRVFEQGRVPACREAGGGDTGWPDLVSAIPAGSPTSLAAYRGGRSHRWVFVLRPGGPKKRGLNLGGQNLTLSPPVSSPFLLSLPKTTLI